MTNDRAIGVFDSGIGGLTVLKELVYNFPNENFIYLGDTARLPYGTKSPSTIRKYSEQNMEFLLSKNVKALVIACNSASTQMLEDHYKSIPLYNVIKPGAEEAVRTSKNSKIGVLGTRATIQSGIYGERIKSLNSKAQVFSVACPLFVPLAEEFWVDDPITNLVVYRYLNQIVQKNIDTLVLGCTHYPILKNSIARVTGSDIILVDSGEAISKSLKKDMDSQRIQPSPARTTLEICVTDGSEQFLKIASKILYPAAIDHFNIVNV